MDIYVNLPQVVRMWIPSSNACCSFRSIIVDFVLLILFTVLLQFLTQFVNTYSSFWSSWTSMGLNHCFSKSFLNSATKALWVWLYFVAALQKPTLCLSKSFFTSILDTDPLSHWNTFEYLKVPTCLYVGSNTNKTSLAFLVLRALMTLYLNATITLATYN